MSKKLRVAIVGCGGIANQKHMPSIKANADKAEMVAFCDTILERAEKAAKEYGTEDAKVYTDYQEMLVISLDARKMAPPEMYLGRGTRKRLKWKIPLLA